MSTPRQVAPAQVRPAGAAAVAVPTPVQPGPPRAVAPAQVGGARVVAVDAPSLPPAVVAELASLRQEVADLRAEVERLRAQHRASPPA